MVCFGLLVDATIWCTLLFAIAIFLVGCVTGRMLRSGHTDIRTTTSGSFIARFFSLFGGIFFGCLVVRPGIVLYHPYPAVVVGVRFNVVCLVCGVVRSICLGFRIVVFFVVENVRIFRVVVAGSYLLVLRLHIAGT